MAIPETDEQVNLKATQDLMKKMKLERKFAADVRRLFRQISVDFAGHYIQNFQVIDLNDYVLDLTAILRSNYRRIADKFGFEILKEVDGEKNWIPFESKDDAYFEDAIKSKALFEHLLSIDNRKQITNKEREMILDATLAAEIKVLSAKEADMIMATTQKLLEQDVNNVISHAALKGDMLSVPEIADAARIEFNEQGVWRSELIAETETQSMAELSKQTELDVLMATSATISGVLLLDAVSKEWVTTLDSVTRDAHVLADGQNVPINESYLVGGELLKQPGDPSASPENRIRCRCDSVTRKGARP